MAPLSSEIESNRTSWVSVIIRTGNRGLVQMIAGPSLTVPVADLRYSIGFRMALLTLVRHGQASFLESNYDKLSERGERQSRILGEYWLRTSATFDQVYYGPACRHLRTGEIVAEVYRRAGAAWPEPVTLPELDEYPGIE